MIATGEQTGDLDTLMGNVARHMTEEADATAQRMVPVLFIVTFLVVAIFVAYYVISSWVGHYTQLLEF
jgi:type II secretory pathway component PulF